MNNSILSLSIKVLLIILFIGCLFNMPYEYFQIVRYIGTVGFIYLAIDSEKNKESQWMWVWIASAFLINPIIKANLGRELWDFVDVFWSILLAISIIKIPKKKPKKPTLKQKLKAYAKVAEWVKKKNE